VRTVFEAVRTAPQCLVAAYERLVPIPYRPTRSAVQSENPSGAVVAAETPRRRRTERG